MATGQVGPVTCDCAPMKLYLQDQMVGSCYSPTYCYGCFHTIMVVVVEKPQGLKYSLSGPLEKKLGDPYFVPQPEGPNSNLILLPFCFTFSSESLHQVLLAPSPITMPESSFLLENHNFIWIFLVPKTKKVALPQLQKEK